RGRRRDARLPSVALRLRIEGNKLLGDQCSEHVKAGARHEAQLACNGLHTERCVAFTQQAQNGRRTRDGGRLTCLYSSRELAVRSRGALTFVVGHAASGRGLCSIYEIIFYICNNARGMAVWVR